MELRDISRYQQSHLAQTLAGWSGLDGLLTNQSESRFAKSTMQCPVHH